MLLRNLIKFIQFTLCATVLAATQAGASGLVPGDLLELQIYGHEDLSVERRVDSDGRFLVPLLGRVTADGLTPEALETAIAEGLQEGGFLEQPSVAVYVLRRQDVFVDGDVDAPGAYQWRPGLTVRQAIALAGGTAGAGKDELSTTLQAYEAQEALERTKSQIDGLRAREARILAEIAFAEALIESRKDISGMTGAEIAFPEDVLARPDLEAIRRTQVSLLRHSEALHLASIRALYLEMATMTRAQELFEQRLTVSEDTLTLLRNRLGELLKASESGLIRTQSVVDMQTAVASAESSQLELLSQITGNLQAIQRQELTIETYGDVIRRDATAALEGLRVDLAVSKAQLPALRRAAAVARSYRVAPGELRVDVDPTIEVQKVSYAGVSTGNLKLQDRVDPGDTLVILRIEE